MKNKTDNKGFSLVELIVVIAIMAVLIAYAAPTYLTYVRDKQAETCTTNREALMAVYERCVIERSKELETAAMEKVCKGQDEATKGEAKQYNECPSGGNYTYEVASGGKMVIKCSHANHTNEVAAILVGWDTSEDAEGDDNPISPP